MSKLAENRKPPTIPKRPRTAYVLFLKDNWNNEDFVGIKSNIEQHKRIVSLFCKLSKDERAKYEKAAKREQRHYEKKLAKYEQYLVQQAELARQEQSYQDYKRNKERYKKEQRAKMKVKNLIDLSANDE